ncbi:uncharacterized protein [Solanum tuberosum]|uniref:uncharacterized protein isoform X2 n=1 Tax=Solanum tuberosum TaxID=4113 RepID=UPI00073A3C90|nr:PREDICTED: uncharacterized protein LOC102579810 isoform X2 [Solanum tuberosum]
MIQFLSASVMAIGSVVGFVGLELATSLLHSGYSLQPLERGFAALWRPHLFQYNISSLRDSGMHHFPSSVFICSFQLPITLIVSVHEENVNIHVAILFRSIYSLPRMHFELLLSKALPKILVNEA